MKTCPACQISKSSEEFYSRPLLSAGLSCYCKVCTRVKQRVAMRKFRAKPGQRATEAAAIRLKREDPAYREHEREQYRTYYYQNVKEMRAKSIRWNHENAERRKQNRAQWFSENPHRRNESRMRGYAAKVQQTPAWAERGYIDLFYRQAKMEEARTGRTCHVDHIVPLRSKLVCGLHCEDNLQVMYATANQRKLNTQWPDMP